MNLQSTVNTMGERNVLNNTFDNKHKGHIVSLSIPSMRHGKYNSCL